MIFIKSEREIEKIHRRLIDLTSRMIKEARRALSLLPVSEPLNMIFQSHQPALMTSTELLTRKLMTSRARRPQQLNVKVKYTSLRLNKRLIKKNQSTLSHLRRDIDQKMLICKEESIKREVKTQIYQPQSKTLSQRLESVKRLSSLIERSLMVLDTQILLSSITTPTCNLRLTL